MRYGSVCSGIEAATVAWGPLGFAPAWFSEVEPFCSALLKYHYPGVTNHGDFTGIGAESGPIDILVGGTPCQSFSVAGLRGGLADARGNLALEFLRLADRLRPRWVVWENVPGVLSSVSHSAPDPRRPADPLDLECDGQTVEVRDSYNSEELHAFNCFLAGLSELGYGWAYRILDAQHFGVPQRRRRVFVVGHLRGWQRAAAVLFERYSLSGYPPPGREAREAVAGSLGGGSGERGWCPDTDSMTFVPDVAYGLNAHPSCRYDAQANETFVTHPLRADGFDASEDGTGRGTPLVPVPILEAGGRTGKSTSDPRAGIGIGEPGDPMFTLQGGHHHAVAFETRFARNGRGAPEEVVPPLKAQSGQTGKGDSSPCVAQRGTVRRLTPRECERLQGFPDDYTLVPYHGKPASDGPRYKALGNSMAVPVMRWIGERIAKVEAVTDDGRARD